MRALRGLAAAVVAIALASCGGSTSYPAATKAWFLANCRHVPGQGSEPCRCALTFLQGNVKLADFQAYERGEWAVVRDLSTGKPAPQVDMPHWAYEVRARCPGLTGGAGLAPFSAPQ